MQLLEFAHIPRLTLLSQRQLQSARPALESSAERMQNVHSTASQLLWEGLMIYGTVILKGD
jgi:hypothetical protein